MDLLIFVWEEVRHPVHVMSGALDMKIGGSHVANIACDKVQGKGWGCSHFKADFLDGLLDASWMGGGAGGMLWGFIITK